MRKFLPHPTTFGPKVVAISARNTKSIQNLQTLQGYIFRILHFATKLCNFTNALSNCGDLFASPCLVLKLLYNGN